MKVLYIIFVILVLYVSHHKAKTNSKNAVIVNIVDIKDFKKLIRTKTNVLICFTSSMKQSSQLVKVFKDAAEVIKGHGTMALVDCSGEAKKMCKKLKVAPEPHILKHYKDGEFNKDYDRKETLSSMVNFMRDPTGDIPWEEDSKSTYVIHIPDSANLAKFIKKESKPLMIMFYAPWCGFCKTLKPEYAAAAEELNKEAVLAAIDVNRPENAAVRTHYNITGFPTLLYYEQGLLKYQYEGDNNKNAIINFMRNPQAPPVKLKEPEWSDVDNEVVHLTSSSFTPVIKEEASVLVMFYAPWCGHCKRMKPEYEKAATIMKDEGIPGMLAAVDATKEQTVASQYSIKGYPTVKYFSYGELKFDVNVREASQIVNFMKNPNEPPTPAPVEVSWSDEETNVVHLNEENFKPFLKKKKHVIVMFYAPWCGHCKKAKPEFAKAADKFKDDAKVEFAAVDCTVHQSICKAMDITGYPTFRYFSYYSKVVKQYTGGRTMTDFIRFMNDPDHFEPGPINIPKDDKDGPIPTSLIRFNDQNFTKGVSKNMYTLVMFYAPWCKHCKTAKPEFAKAAETLRKEGVSCQLAVVDCTENPEVTDLYDISGFPTIKLFKNGKFVKNYTGKRTEDEFKKFMKITTSTKDEL